MAEQRLIDANDAIERLRKAEAKMHTINGVKAVDIGTVISFLQNQLVVDAVPVVWCKDCRWFSKYGYEEANQYEEDLSLHMGYCSEWRRGTQGCRFCSFGEGRDSDV